MLENDLITAHNKIEIYKEIYYIFLDWDSSIRSSKREEVEGVYDHGGLSSSGKGQSNSCNRSLIPLGCGGLPLLLTSTHALPAPLSGMTGGMVVRAESYAIRSQGDRLQRPARQVKDGLLSFLVICLIFSVACMAQLYHACLCVCL